MVSTIGTRISVLPGIDSDVAKGRGLPMAAVLQQDDASRDDSCKAINARAIR